MYYNKVLVAASGMKNMTLYHLVYGSWSLTSHVQQKWFFRHKPDADSRFVTVFNLIVKTQNLLVINGLYFRHLVPCLHWNWTKSPPTRWQRRASSWLGNQLFHIFLWLSPNQPFLPLQPSNHRVPYHFYPPPAPPFLFNYNFHQRVLRWRFSLKPCITQELLRKCGSIN